MRAGDVAIELGAAPGGAAYALLARGLRVYGIDSAEMAPAVRGHAAFTWIRGTAQEALEGGRLPPTRGMAPARHPRARRDRAPGARAVRAALPARGPTRDVAHAEARKLGAGRVCFRAGSRRCASWAWSTCARLSCPGNRQEIAVVALSRGGREWLMRGVTLAVRRRFIHEACLRRLRPSVTRYLANLHHRRQLGSLSPRVAVRTGPA